MEELNPSIKQQIERETSVKVDASLRPLEGKIASYQQIVEAGAIATTAMNGSRTAFYKLRNLSESSNTVVREIASWALASISNEPLQEGEWRTLNPSFGPAEVIKLATNGPGPVRIMALHTMAKAPLRSYIPTVVSIIRTEEDLRVVRAAVEAFVALAKTDIGSNEDPTAIVNKWCGSHKVECEGK